MLKLKTQDFKIRTRNRQLADPTRLADRIFQTGLHLLARGGRHALPADRDRRLRPLRRRQGRPARPGRRQARKRAMAEGAIDSCATSSGRKAVETGYTFGKGRSAHPPEHELDE